MMVQRRRESVTFTLSEEGHERLEQLAKEYFLSRSQVVDGLVRFYDIVRDQAARYQAVTYPDGEQDVMWTDPETERLQEIDLQTEFEDLQRRIGQGLLARAWYEETE